MRIVMLVLLVPLLCLLGVEVIDHHYAAVFAYAVMSILTATSALLNK